MDEFLFFTFIVSYLLIVTIFSAYFKVASVLIIIAIVVVVIIMVKVIPVFSQMYEGMGSSLPFPTLVCIAISNVLIHYFYLVILFGVLIYFGLKQFY